MFSICTNSNGKRIRGDGKTSLTVDIYCTMPQILFDIGVFSNLIDDDI